MGEEKRPYYPFLNEITFNQDKGCSGICFNLFSPLSKDRTFFKMLYFFYALTKFSDTLGKRVVFFLSEFFSVWGKYCWLFECAYDNLRLKIVVLNLLHSNP